MILAEKLLPCLTDDDTGKLVAPAAHADIGLAARSWSSSPCAATSGSPDRRTTPGRADCSSETPAPPETRCSMPH